MQIWKSLIDTVKATEASDLSEKASQEKYLEQWEK